MKRLPLTLGFVGTCVLTASLLFVQQSQPAAQGQGGGQGGGRGGGAQPAPPTNLQVLPKDIAVPELQATMQGIAAGLGVQCTYCHVPPKAPPADAPPPPPPAAGAAPAGRGRGGPPPLDFAADDKPEKSTARVMLRMVSTVNETINKEFGKSGEPVVRVECVTCHHGVAKPEQLSTILSQTMLSKGEGAALAKYRELRTQYYGSQSYDFTEPVLVRLAQQSLATNKPDDALAWAKLNLEIYPKSAPTLVVMSQVHARKKDTSAAMKDLEQALVIDPNNAQAKRQLNQLKAQPQ